MKSDIIEVLKPQNVFKTKKRIGPPEDGGYVMIEEVFQNCSALFTYGVGNDIRFEEEFRKLYGKPAYLFDHTIGRESWSNNGLTFKPEGLGFSDKCKDVSDHYTELNMNGDILLKIDIEGYEFDYFSRTDISKIASITMGMILEVHWIDDINNRNSLINMFNKFEDYFVLCHVHGNNWGDLWVYNGNKIPKVLELSFINRRFVDIFEVDNQSYPIKGLDISNKPNAEDYDLSFLKTI